MTDANDDQMNEQNETNSTDRILRLPEVISRIGLRRASIYAKMTQGSFPKPISLGARAVGWLESEIDEWLAERIRLTQRYQMSRLKKPNENSM